MTILADDPTAAAILDAVPCYPVPPSGRSPAIDALRESRAGHGLAVGKNGVMLILRRPWLAMDVMVALGMDAYLPYGETGQERAELRCGLIPHELMTQILTQFRHALPNEAAAFIIWNEETRAFTVDFPVIDDATPSRVVYQTPTLPPHCHVVLDVHSHGKGKAFFSSTDDADDINATKIAMVVGRLHEPGVSDTSLRLCANGMFLPMARSPFTGVHEIA